MTHKEVGLASFDLLNLAKQDSELKKVGSYWIGPCPFCAGDDRFNLKTTAEVDLWICRKCGDGKYKNAIHYLMQRNGWTFGQAIRHVQGIEESVIKNREKVRAIEHSKRKQDVAQKLAEFTNQEIWDELHRRMIESEEHREWWRKNGVPDPWQDYLSLGWTPEKKYISSKDGELHSASAYTIPYFADEKQFVTMQYRMCGEVSSRDRYRFEYGLDTTFYRTTPTLPIGEKVVVCEGAKKAITTRTYLPNELNITVLAVPSKSDFGDIAQHLEKSETVWILFDPDGTDRAEILAQEIGIANALIVELPCKVDDMFLAGHIDTNVFLNIVRQGVKTN